MSTYDISAERNVWLQSALRSFAIVCDYMETGLFAIACDLRSAIVCDPRSSAIVCDHMETSLSLSPSDFRLVGSMRTLDDPTQFGCIGQPSFSSGK